MTSVRNNVVSEILECIKILNSKKKQLDQISCTDSCNNNSNAKKTCPIKAFCIDTFMELDEALSSLASSLITAPISGRMFIPLPPAYVTQEEKDKSLSKQLKLAF